jgi:hypothetical protein
MKQLIALFLMLIMTGTSCEEHEHEGTKLEDGMYTGTFKRSSPTGDYITANITITLEDGVFSGTSDFEKYPGICNGTFSSNEDKIAFEDVCVWTADFDWTLILDGTFDIISEGDEIILSRSYEGDMHDQYRITKHH